MAGGVPGGAAATPVRSAMPLSTLSALVDLLRQEDGSRSRELVLQALEVVLAWRASSVDARRVSQVQL